MFPFLLAFLDRVCNHYLAGKYNASRGTYAYFGNFQYHDDITVTQLFVSHCVWRPHIFRRRHIMQKNMLNQQQIPYFSIPKSDGDMNS